MRSALPWGLIGLLTACNLDSGLIVSNGAPVDAAVESLAVHGGPDAPIVRSIGPLGTTVPATGQTLRVDGSDVVVVLDTYGYGTLDLAPGSYAVDGSGDDAIHITDGAWSSVLPAAHAGLGTASFLEPARDGVLAAVGNSAWFVGPRMPPHAVVTLDAPINGIRTGQIDEDGVPDAVVWGGEYVVALRGRPGGGFAFGWGVKAEGWQAEAAGLGDLDQDGSRDLVIAWGGSQTLQIWGGNGLWDFEPVYERKLSGEPFDLSVGADRGDGEAIVTVITDEARWTRVAFTAAGEFVLTGPPIDVDATPGTTLRSGGDVNDDGTDDQLVVQPRATGVERELYIWDLSGDNAQFLRLAWPGAWLAFGDANGDGLLNPFSLEETTNLLRYVTFDGEQYVIKDVEALPEFGPTGIADADGDFVPDALIADEVWAWYPGRRDDTDEARWRVQKPASTVYQTDLTGPYTADGQGGFVGFTQAAGVTRLSRWRAGTDTLESVGSIGVDATGADAVDLATCDGVAYALTAGELVLVDVQTVTVRERVAVVDPVAVACGDGPGDATVAVLAGGVVSWFDDQGASLGQRVEADAVDVALVSDGTDGEVVACSSACWGWNHTVGDQGALVNLDAQGLVVTTGPDQVRLPGGGDVNVDDVDGDGLPDLLARWGQGWVTVVRSTGQGVAPPRYLHGDPTWQGAPQTGALEGAPLDLWFVRDGDLIRARPAD